MLKAKTDVSDNELIFIGHQLLLGASIFHSQGVYHRNIKPGNLVWVTRPGIQDRQLVFSKFGYGTLNPIELVLPINFPQLNVAFRPPELMFTLDDDNKKEFLSLNAKKADEWAIGCILYNLAMKVHPFFDDKKPLYEMVKCATESPELPAHKFPLASKLVKSLMEMDLKNRMDARMGMIVSGVLALFPKSNFDTMAKCQAALEQKICLSENPTLKSVMKANFLDIAKDKELYDAYKFLNQ